MMSSVRVKNPITYHMLYILSHMYYTLYAMYIYRIICYP